MGVGFGNAAARFGGIVPTAVMAQEQLRAETGVEDASNTIHVPGVVEAVAADGVVLDPGAAAGHLQVEIKIRFVLCVDPDKALGRVPRLLYNVELVAHHLPTDRMA